MFFRYVVQLESDLISSRIVTQPFVTEKIEKR